MVKAFGVVAALSAGAAGASGQTAFYERATQPPTGQTPGGGLTVSSNFYTGWRFEVTNGPIQTVRIGAHFYQGTGTVFGALVRLTGPNDHPDSFALTTPDVIGTALAALPASGGSNVGQAELGTELVNGWYLVVFGSGAFGATSTNASLVAQDPATAVPGAQLNITYRQNPPAAILQGSVARVFVEYSTGAACYANCDASTASPVLNVADFTCFLTKFAGGDPYANCDGSTAEPVLNVADFTCFLTKFAGGCP